MTAGSAELEVQDLDSTNGTFVNGTRVERALLKDGDRLGIGRVELTIELFQAELRNGFVFRSRPIVVDSPWPE